MISDFITLLEQHNLTYILDDDGFDDGYFDDVAQRLYDQHFEYGDITEVNVIEILDSVLGVPEHDVNVNGISDFIDELFAVIREN